MGERKQSIILYHENPCSRACHQLKDFVAKMASFENRIAEYIEVFEKRKRKKLPFAGQKAIIDDTP